MTKSYPRAGASVNRQASRECLTHSGIIYSCFPRLAFFRSVPTAGVTSVSTVRAAPSTRVLASTASPVTKTTRLSPKRRAILPKCATRRSHFIWKVCLFEPWLASCQSTPSPSPIGSRLIKVLWKQVDIPRSPKPLPCLRPWSWTKSKSSLVLERVKKTVGLHRHRNRSLDPQHRWLASGGGAHV